MQARRLPAAGLPAARCWGYLQQRDGVVLVRFRWWWWPEKVVVDKVGRVNTVVHGTRANSDGTDRLGDDRAREAGVRSKSEGSADDPLDVRGLSLAAHLDGAVDGARAADLDDPLIGRRPVQCDGAAGGERKGAYLMVQACGRG